MSNHNLLKIMAVVAAVGSLSRAATVAPVQDSGAWADVAEAAHPAVYASVPLPSGVYGSGACVLLVVALRLSRHRRWVTLR